jgi:cis-L-3-hydroxyproline dehydratase
VHELGPADESILSVNLALDGYERGMLNGTHGPAVQLAMRILTRMAPLYGASSLLPVTRAHIDGVILTGAAGLDFAERLANLGGQVAVPTSLNVMSMDRERSRELNLETEFTERARRLGQAYIQMGARATFTCAPYQTENTPSFGEQIAWSESNAVAFANSVIGARTNRYGDYLDICCALTGRAPAAGLHLDEPRLATVVVELESIPPDLLPRDDFYPVLGYLLGAVVANEVPVVHGLEFQPSQDQLKAMGAAAASSGEVAMFHIAGITPEATTLAEALGNRRPRRTVPVTIGDLRRTRAALTTTTGSRVDVVAFGSPHCSLAECRVLAALMSGFRASESVEVFVTTSRAVRDILARSGELKVIEDFGARVTADTCIVVAPLVKPTAEVLMTNSAKYAHYGPGLLGVDSIFATTEECVASAIAGHAIRAEGPWAA